MLGSLSSLARSNGPGVSPDPVPLRAVFFEPFVGTSEKLETGTGFAACNDRFPFTVKGSGSFQGKIVERK